MKLKTSFFNPTILKKDITRFAPLWGLYTVFMLMYLLLIWASGMGAHDLMDSLQYLLSGMASLNLCYAGFAALLLYSDLFKSRLCNALHALPLRREGWFLTHLVSGLLFSIIPNLLCAFLGAVMLGQYAYGAAIWLAVMVMEYIVFFGFAVFSVMCAGNGLGAAAVYGLINFLAPLSAWLVCTFYEPLLYGMRVDMAAISRLSPVVLLTDTTFLETEYDRFANKTFLHDIPADAWLLLGICTAVSLVLLALALLLYRKRNLESAGDLISFKPAGPVFLVLYTLCIASVIFFITLEITGALGYVFLVVGLAIGFFTGRMLLEKRVGVFRWKNLLAFGIFVGVFALSMVLTFLDPIGITRYVPKADKVQCVSISPYYSDYSVRYQNCTLTETEDIQAIIDLHQQALDLRVGFYSMDTHVNICYELKNGTTVVRNYDLPESEKTQRLLNSFYSRPECVLQGQDPQLLLKRVHRITFTPYKDFPCAVFLYAPGEDIYFEEKFGIGTACVDHPITGSFAEDEIAVGLMEAILADCEAGTLAQWNNTKDTVGYINMEYLKEGLHQAISICVYEDSENTLAYLESLQQQ